MSPMNIMLCVFALFSPLGASAAGLRAQGALALQGPGTVTAMAGLEGEACPPDEYARYTRIVCKIEEACGCADHTCTLDWCAGYVHDWKKEFGACLLKGCVAEPKDEERF
mmetsp:Transcript_57436/g.151176  ORF Transcript_57436/g.151176 Transcript_57436/m.151176 type:complete len:110 (-) Transcript_57436:57-386(-)